MLVIFMVYICVFEDPLSIGWPGHQTLFKTFCFLNINNRLDVVNIVHQIYKSESQIDIKVPSNHTSLGAAKFDKPMLMHHLD